MSEKQAVLPPMREFSSTNGWGACRERESQLLALLQSLADAGIEVVDGRVKVGIS